MENNTFAQERDRRKRRRVIFQALMVIAVLALVVYTTITLPARQGDIVVEPTATPKPSRLALNAPAVSAADGKENSSIGAGLGSAYAMASTGATQRESGFVAISYVGVGTKEGETVISDVRLSKHLRALHDRGYVTITQQDIYDYFYSGKPLPERALFLFFEDGRMQSAKLAHPLLKQYNYKASMISYANNVEQGDPLFLTDEELLELEGTGYWEMGTNGYRLSYINVFDRHKNFLDELTPLEYYFISPYVRREYNHYLMDFIRDKHDTPVESFEQMKARVEEDYRLMDSVYTQYLGKLPGLYVLMHSNTGQFGTNSTVSAENDKWIRQYFTMNFNREMLSVNKPDANIYDLTRMQPQSYWSVNHLLMRIYHDTNQLGVLPFELGNTERAAHWEILQGAAEWDGNTIRITSLPEGEGRIRLAGSEGLSNFTLETVVDGNKLGKQAIEILADSSALSYTAVELQKNKLLVYNGSAGLTPDYLIQEAAAAENTASSKDKGDIDLPPESSLLFELDLDVLDGVVYQTWEENRQEAMAVEIDRKLLQTYQPVESRRIAADLIRAKADTSKVNNDPYIPEISLKDDGSRLIKIEVSGGRMSIWVDNRQVANHIDLPAGQAGGIALRSAWIEYGYSQRNLADDVYDADFTNLLITSPGQAGAVIDYRGEQEALKLTPLPAGYSGVAVTANPAADLDISNSKAEAAADQNGTVDEKAEEKNSVGFFESIGDWFRKVLHF